MEVTKLDEGQEWVDVMGSGIRTKHIFRGEIGPAEMGTVVSCNLTGYFGDDTEHTEPFETLRDQVFVIGEMDSIPSIELTLRYLWFICFMHYHPAYTTKTDNHQKHQAFACWRYLLAEIILQIRVWCGRSTRTTARIFLNCSNFRQRRICW